MSNRKINICIVSHMAYGALKGGERGHAGGVEFQTSLLAKWLASRGHKVSFITWDEGGPKEEMVGGVRVIKLCRVDDGIPGVRFFHPRWTSLIRALKRANADIYYHNLGEYATGQIALWSKVNNKKFVFYVASDKECVKPPLLYSRFYDRILFLLGAKIANSLLAQTYQQKRMLQRNYGLIADIMHMPCTFDVKNTEITSFKERRNEILWIGRITRVKRLEWLIEAAKLLPSINFHVVGKYTPSNPYEKELVGKLYKIPNITYHGMVPHGDLPPFYSRAKVFLNTSIVEGFPNTFLEAWGFGLPVVSSFDPDNTIKEHKIGIAVNSCEEMIEAIKQLMNSEPLWLDMSQRAKSYCVKYHAPETVLRRFERYFLELL